MIAYAVRRLPYALRSCMAALQQLHVSLEEAAENLGADEGAHGAAHRRAADGGRHPRRLRHQLHHRRGRALGDHRAVVVGEPGADVVRHLSLHAEHRRPRPGRGARRDRGRDRRRSAPMLRTGCSSAAPSPARSRSTDRLRSHASRPRRSSQHRSSRTAATQVLRDITLDGRAGRVLRAPRALGLGQVDAAAAHRRLQPAPGGRAARSAARDVTGIAAVEAQRRHGVPELRALAAHDGGAQRRLRPRGAPAAARARSGAGPTPRSSWSASPATASAARASSPAASSSGSRSPARWRSSRRCCCSTSRSPTSTPSCACRCARSCSPAPAARHHDDLRHPRPGRGDDDLRPHRRDGPGRDPAGRHADRAVRRARPTASSPASSARSTCSRASSEQATCSSRRRSANAGCPRAWRRGRPDRPAWRFARTPSASTPRPRRAAMASASTAPSPPPPSRATRSATRCGSAARASSPSSRIAAAASAGATARRCGCGSRPTSCA